MTNVVTAAVVDRQAERPAYDAAIRAATLLVRVNAFLDAEHAGGASVVRIAALRKLLGGTR